MARRILTLFGVLIAAFGVCATAALAADSASDPRDGGKLDVKRISDSVDAKLVTYRVETYDGFNNDKDFYMVRWFFDLDGDGRAVDMCIRLEKVLDGPLRATLYPKCGPAAFATADATKPSDNVVEFQFRTVDLVDAGMVPAKPVAYMVRASDMDGKIDTVPDQGLVQQSPLPKPSIPGQQTGGGGSVTNELAQSGTKSGSGAAPNELADSGVRQQSAASRGGGASDAHKAFPVAWIVIGVIGGLMAGVVIVLLAQRRLVWVDAGDEGDRYTGPRIETWEPSLLAEEGDVTSPRVHTHDA